MITSFPPATGAWLLQIEETASPAARRRRELFVKTLEVAGVILLLVAVAS